jgi:hypothetical protein
MAEQPVKKEEKELVPSGPVAPTEAELARDIESYEIRVSEFVIAPRVEILKDGELVKVVENARQMKVAGTINPAYRKQLLSDIVNDFKIGYTQAYFRAAAEEAKQTQRSEE